MVFNIFKCVHLAIIQFFIVNIVFHCILVFLVPLQYDPSHNCVLSVDVAGNIEYWDPVTLELPACVHFEFKGDTSLYEFAKVCL